jgi:DNA (cytosine-5)-methyltransferase 1
MNTQQIQMVSVNVPDVATKQLKVRRNEDRKIVTLSSNWLALFQIDGSKRVVEESMGPGKGIRVRLANDDDIEQGIRTKKVYERTYTRRSANPINDSARRKELQVEIASQKLINESLGAECEYVHITFKQGELLFVPMDRQKYELLQSLKGDEKINTLVALTGGVDCAVLEESGFRVDTVVEYRPQEKRDKTDYTEMTSMSALVNSKPRVLINEDIYTLNPVKLAALVGDTPLSVGHFSIQCDDFSNVKNKKQKASSVEDMSSTIDMIIPVLDMISALSIPVVVVENVPNFMNSMANDIFTMQLRRRGFKVHQEIFNATEHGGNTTRKRMYMVATALDAEFNFPVGIADPSKSVWDEIIVPNLEEIMKHDVTDNKVIKDAFTTGRVRTIEEGKQFAPTLLKAQGQDTKDAVIVSHNGRAYRLPVNVQKQLNCIPESFDLSWAPIDKAAQIIGQSICCSLHHRIMESVKNHIHAAANVIKAPFAYDETGQQYATF